MKKSMSLEEMKEIYKINNTKKQSKTNTDYWLPKDTNANLKKIKKIENLLLLINKSIKQIYDNKRQKYEFKLGKIYSPKFFNYEEYYQSCKKIVANTKEFNLNTNWRLIIGLGSASVYETSLTLHYIYGIPYIPASAIKGSFRSYIINKYFDNEEKTALKSDWFINIFGNENRQGKVIFFDAFSKDAEIQKDIMNPHYPDYYDGKKPPTDDQNPRPINFLVVTGKFQFLVGVKNNFDISLKNEKKPILDFVEKELKKSLQNFGIGAKTSIGYGYFN